MVPLRPNHKYTMSTSSPIVSITFFEYGPWRARWWAFRQMGLAPAQLAEVAGLSFCKMLGTGSRNGFSIWPNTGLYGLLCVWADEAAAEAFRAQHPLYATLCDRSRRHWTVLMRTAMAHGEWEGERPFVPNGIKPGEDTPVAVITRATIRLGSLWQFWRYVPSVSRSMDGSPGLLFSVGIGELPLIQQATFSLWRSARDMRAYAYQGKAHSEVVKKTRELDWYKEELFARFVPYAVLDNEALAELFEKP